MENFHTWQFEIMTSNTFLKSLLGKRKGVYWGQKRHLGEPTENFKYKKISPKECFLTCLCWRCIALLLKPIIVGIIIKKKIVH